MARKTSFYYSFLVLPAEQRRAITAVWDFCRAVDDAIDEEPAEPAAATPTGREAVPFWRDELARCYNGTVPTTVQGRDLQPFIREFDLPRSAFEDVIDGVAMDLDIAQYETFDALYEYCRRVASAVGLVCIRIFGCDSRQSCEYALNLGIALQLTNILRDVGGDLNRGRLYMPLADLAEHGVTIDDVKRRVMTPAIRNLVAFECGRARAFYDRALAALPAEDKQKLVAAEIMRAVYFETLRRIERQNYDVFSARVRVARPRQALIALRQWLLK